MQSYRATNGQSVLDVCLSVYGTLDYLIKLIVDSEVSGVDYVPRTGDVFYYDNTLTVNSNAFQKREVARYATLYRDNSVVDFGIDFGDDFFND
jgi:hypothetical protein